MKPMTDDTISPDQGYKLIWIALIVTCGVCLTPLFACVTPFAAFATLAALKLEWRGGLLVLALVWLANQAIGYGLLGYPWTWDSVAWGAAIGLSAELAMLAAIALSTDRSARLAVSLPFVAAFTAFELTLYLAAFILPCGDGAFSPTIVSHLFLINAATLCVLTILYHLTILFGLHTRLDILAPAATASPR